MQSLAAFSESAGFDEYPSEIIKYFWFTLDQQITLESGRDIGQKINVGLPLKNVHIMIKKSFLHQSVVIFKRLIKVELTFLINLGPMFIADYRVVMNFLFVFRF